MFKNNGFIHRAVAKHRYPSVDFRVVIYETLLNQILNQSYSNDSEDALREKSLQLRVRALQGAAVHDLLPEAYALVREAVTRTLRITPHDAQIYAAIALHVGSIVEMQTGEGKTLAAVFPAYLNALTGRGVHILTFNDYLAQRDAQWMSPVYALLGVSVGAITDGMEYGQRRKAYQADVTYLTAKEAGFDYLRGFLSQEVALLVQRPFHYAIIDEADSIMIDEARIPLVIAGKTDSLTTDAISMNSIIRELVMDKEYETDEYGRSVYLTDDGLLRVEQTLGCDNLYNGNQNAILADIHNALHAHVLLKRDIDYIVRNGHVELVDEFTGRIAEKRHWPHGLQEAVEAKEGIVSKDQGQIMSSITLQYFLKQYPKISGMTGTALVAAEEFQDCYALRTVIIPTHRPCIRIDHPDKVFTHKEAKMQALIEEIKCVHATGRPILVGTLTVEESETLAKGLTLKEIKCQVLNARNDEEEARIVKEAGALGAVTVSTNMAGRGTDIKLGGADERDRDKVTALGGLYVLGTNRHESHRIDQQLRGRAGRQGDPGSTRFFTSLEDDLLKRYRLKDLIPKTLYPRKQWTPLSNPIRLLLKECE